MLKKSISKYLGGKHHLKTDEISILKDIAIYPDNITQQTILLMKFKKMINIDNKTSKEYTNLSEFIQKEIFKFKLKQYSLSVLELKTLDNILNSNFKKLKHFVYLKTKYENMDIVKSGFFSIQ